MKSLPRSLELMSLSHDYDVGKGIRESFREIILAIKAKIAIIYHVDETGLVAKYMKNDYRNPVFERHMRGVLDLLVYKIAMGELVDDPGVVQQYAVTVSDGILGAKLSTDDRHLEEVGGSAEAVGVAVDHTALAKGSLDSGLTVMRGKLVPQIESKKKFTEESIERVRRLRSQMSEEFGDKTMQDLEDINNQNNVDEQEALRKEAMANLAKKSMMNSISSSEAPVVKLDPHSEPSIPMPKIATELAVDPRIEHIDPIEPDADEEDIAIFNRGYWHYDELGRVVRGATKAFINNHFLSAAIEDTRKKYDPSLDSMTVSVLMFEPEKYGLKPSAVLMRYRAARDYMGMELNRGVVTYDRSHVRPTVSVTETTSKRRSYEISWKVKRPSFKNARSNLKLAV